MVGHYGASLPDLQSDQAMSGWNANVSPIDNVPDYVIEFVELARDR